ncbi:MAG: hypothetical protein CEN90_347 [Parcubacteria group bacterium Licking1014_17]|nr:MAG: hypothetical protein CEN90_347 [Parcubacteria group bacterium Licking1014_17]
MFKKNFLIITGYAVIIAAFLLFIGFTDIPGRQLALIQIPAEDASTIVSGCKFIESKSGYVKCQSTASGTVMMKGSSWMSQTFDFESTASYSVDIYAEGEPTGTTLKQWPKMALSVDGRNYRTFTVDNNATWKKYSQSVSFADGRHKMTIRLLAGSSVLSQPILYVNKVEVVRKNPVLSGPLILTPADNPKSGIYAKGATNVEMLGVNFTAVDSTSVNVTDIKLTGYISDDGMIFAKSLSLPQNDDGLSIGDRITAIRLFEGDTSKPLDCIITANNLSLSVSTIQFSACNWTISAGTTKRLLVKGDISSNATSGSSDSLSFDIESTTDITGTDDVGGVVHASYDAPPNGITNPKIIVTVGSSGILNISQSPMTPTRGAKFWGQTGTEFSRFRVTSGNDAFFIERVTLTPLDANEKINFAGNVANTTIVYKNKSGQELTQNAMPDSSGVAIFAFTGDSRPYIPKDSSAELLVKADLKTKSQGATNNKFFSIDFSDNYKGSTTDSFRAVGEISGQVLNGASPGINDVKSNDIYVYQVYPEFHMVPTSGYEPVNTNDVIKFTITAMGAPDSVLWLDNSSLPAGSIVFDAVASGDSAATDLVATTYDASDGTIKSVDTIRGAGDNPNVYAPLILDFLPPGNDIEISAGSSRTYRIEINFSGFPHRRDFFQLALRDNQNGLINWTSGNQATGSTAGILRTLPMNGPTFSKL